MKQNISHKTKQNTTFNLKKNKQKNLGGLCIEGNTYERYKTQR